MVCITEMYFWGTMEASEVPGTNDIISSELTKHKMGIELILRKEKREALGNVSMTKFKYHLNQSNYNSICLMS